MKTAQLASSATATMELLHPVTEEPTGVFVTGYTPDSNEYKRLEAKIVHSGNTSTAFIVEKKKQKMEIDPKAAEKQMKLWVATITNIVGFDDWEYSEEGKGPFLNNPDFWWIPQQWGAWIGDRANFFGQSPKPASRTSKA